MQVPLLDLKEQFKPFREQVLEEVAAIFDSQYFINGPAVAAFEKDVSEYCSCKAAVGVSSGSDALILSLMALEIGQGDEVITTPYTFFATAGSIARVGARPVFVDIEPDTFNIDPSQIESVITDKTKAIMPVHLYGQTADMDPILAMAEKHNLHVIEDAAQSMGARYKDMASGTMGTVGCFSFFPSKNLGGAGDAGMIVTQDEALAKKMLSLRNHGARERYFHDFIGGNFRMDTIQAAYLKIKLPQLNQWASMRAANAAHYKQKLEHVEQIQLPRIRSENTSVYNQYIIRAQRRDDLIQHLKQANIGTSIYYPLSLHQQKCFAYLGYEPDAFPHSRQAADETLAVPIYPEMTTDQLNHVSQSIIDFYQ